MLHDCPKHGLVKHYRPSDRNQRCSKCSIEAVNKRRVELKILAVNYKGGKCELCDYNKSFKALEFHHKDPSCKDFAISGGGFTRSFEKMKPELDKCMLLCANCHREEHERLNTEEK